MNETRGKQADLKARLQRLKDEAGRADADAPSAQDALRLQMAALLEKADPDQRFLEALRIAVAVEQLERIRREIANNDTLGSKLLELASGAARDGYREGLRLLTSVSAGRRQISRFPEPVVLFEPMATPMTMNRGGSIGLNFTGGSATAIPFPLVFIPHYPDTSVGSLCVIQHEVGHNLDEDFGISESIEPLLENRLSESNNQDVDTWLAWLPELAADVFGLILAGTALAVELADWARVLGDDNALASSTHPYPSVRVRFAEEVMTLLGIELSDAVASLLDIPTAERTDETTRLLKQTPEVATAMMCSPIPHLGHMEFRDLASGAADDHRDVLNAAQKLTDSSDAEHLNTIPYRLIPSVANIAIAFGAEPNSVFTKLQAACDGRKDATAVRLRHATFVINSIKDVVPPILDVESDQLKRPPADLFRTVREVSFVGAQNDGLPKLFQKYLATDARPKRHINIFYLTEQVLSRMTPTGQSPDVLISWRTRSLAALTPEFMNSIADSWQIFEHDEPYFFASYWDASAPGGRIHTSSHGWGQNIKYAPAVDYVWPEHADRPNRKYRWYLDSLSGLFEKATLMTSG